MTGREPHDETQGADEHARRIMHEAARLADEVADRMGADPAAPPGGPTVAPGADAPPADSFAWRELRAGLDRALDANLNLLRMVMDLTADVAERAWSSAPLRRAARRDDHETAPAPVVAGHVAATTVWLHNTAAAAAGPLTLVATPLVGDTGAWIAPDAVSLDPSTIVTIAPGETIPVAVEIRVPPTTPPDRYVGRIVVPEWPDDPVTVTLDVVAVPS